MAIAIDAVSTGTVGATPTFTHTPVGTPKGVLVLVAEDNDNSTGITVTYGPNTLSQVTGSPVRFDSTNDTSVYAFFLGTSVPTGARQVTVTGDSFTRLVTCITFTATGDVEVVDTSTSTTTTVNPTVSLTLGGATAIGVVVAAVGGAAVGQVSSNAGWTQRAEALLNLTVGHIATYDTIGSTDITAGVTCGAFPVSMLGVALRDTSAGGVEYTLVADQGTYTLSGQANTLLAGGGMSANSGTYSLLGSEALRDIEIDADQGSYALNGQVTTLRSAFILGCAVGSYLLHGQSAQFAYSAAIVTVAEEVTRHFRRVAANRGFPFFGRY